MFTVDIKEVLVLLATSGGGNVYNFVFHSLLGTT